MNYCVKSLDYVKISQVYQFVVISPHLKSLEQISEARSPYHKLMLSVQNTLNVV